MGSEGKRETNTNTEALEGCSSLEESTAWDAVGGGQPSVF